MKDTFRATLGLVQSSLDELKTEKWTWGETMWKDNRPLTSPLDKAIDVLR